MSAAAAAATEHEALELVEGIQVAADGPWYDHPKYGRVAKLHIIRPGLGRGKGRHIYEAAMLERSAGVFAGWKMFQDHLSDAAKKALGGLPRRIRDTGGIIKESFWDPSVPPDPEKGYGQGAVVGYARVVPLVRELIDTDSSLVEASINATATGVKPVTHGGQTAWLVEGISPRGSVDWVTEAGAGGKVVSLMEAFREETLQEARAIEADLLTELDDDEFRGYLSRERPALLEALTNSHEEKEGEVADAITPEALEEALTKAEDGKVGVLDRLLADRLDVSKLAEALVPALKESVDAAVQEAVKGLGETVLTDAQADAQRQIKLRDMRDVAHGIIREARLPEAYQKVVTREFDLTESGPTPKLDQIDEIDGEGNVVKTAEQKLREAVEAELKEARELLAAARPTQVRGMAATSAIDDADGGKEGEDKKKKPSTGSSLNDEFLREARVPEEELGDLYEGIFALHG